MSDRPALKLGDWIKIGQTECVVSQVRPAGNPLGDCEVVFNPPKPTNADAKWTGSDWAFVESGDFGGYADKYDRLRSYVRQLKQGRT